MDAREMTSTPRRRVAIVVLGDLGRSPRMQYHAWSMAQDGVAVDLIGLAGKRPMSAVHDEANIHIILLPDDVGHRGARIVKQTLHLADTLLRRIRRPDLLLVQSPPALPTIPLAWLVTRLRRSELVIDWHNFGYAMAGLKLGRDHWAVGVTRWVERFFGRRADRHLCVSRAMADELERQWGIAAEVVHDRPGPQFHPTEAPQRERDLDDLLSVPRNAKGARPAVVVTATSWSADEDFELLLAAAARLDQLLRDHSPGHAGVLIVITGDGPGRPEFERRRERLGATRVILRTMWLSWSDYPRLLAAADVGLCLHRSASGVDLPMKVQDMFGAGLPVCALDYGPCLREAIVPGETGWLFRDATELADQLFDLFSGDPAASPQLVEMRRKVIAMRSADPASTQHQ